MPSQAGSHSDFGIAAAIDAAIIRLNMTNRAVAEKIGTTEHQVWRWRKGRVRPNLDNLAALADVLFEGEIGAMYERKDAA